MSAGVRLNSDISVYSSDILTHLRYLTSKYGADGVDNPFYVADLSALIEQYRKWGNALPRISPFYAVKCNDDMVILKTLAALGTGFDCANQMEIKRVLSLGISPSRIIYAHPFKQISMLKYARSKNVDLLVFDSLAELHKVSILCVLVCTRRGVGAYYYFVTCAVLEKHKSWNIK
jgi:diaminopimelate decarboxylase